VTTNCANTLITPAPDSAIASTVPPRPGTVAQLQHALLTAEPYRYTSDDLLFEVHAIRHGIAPADRGAARSALFAKPQACLRASPLVKQFGWGIHHDAEGRVALHARDSADYEALAARPDMKLVPGMRQRRA
jgi:hypothetical protein